MDLVCDKIEFSFKFRLEKKVTLKNKINTKNDAEFNYTSKFGSFQLKPATDKSARLDFN